MSPEFQNYIYMLAQHYRDNQTIDDPPFRIQSCLNDVFIQRLYNNNKSSPALDTLGRWVCNYMRNRRHRRAPRFPTKKANLVVYQPFITAEIGVPSSFPLMTTSPTFAIEPYGCVIKLIPANIFNEGPDCHSDNVHDFTEETRLLYHKRLEEYPHKRLDFIRVGYMEAFGLLDGINRKVDQLKNPQQENESFADSEDEDL